jgi:hypothetical protein
VAIDAVTVVGKPDGVGGGVGGCRLYRIGSSRESWVKEGG